MKRLILAAVITAGFASAGHAVRAMPALHAGSSGSAIVQVEGGCGPGGHRGPYGRCYPNYRRPYYRACPPGFFLGRFGHCRRY